MSERNLYKGCLFGRYTTIGILPLLVGAFLLGCTGEPKYDPLDTSGNEGIISKFREGMVKIGGKTYRRPDDIIIFPDRVKYGWSGLVEDHSLQVEEIQEVANGTVTTLIIGTGTEGDVRVPKSTLDFLKSNGIEALIMNSHEAVDLYNKSSKDNLACVLHLTN